jgi:ABC-2 type transport system permease protein
MLAQAILYRRAGLSVVWPQFIAFVGIGIVLLLTVPGAFSQNHKNIT